MTNSMVALCEFLSSTPPFDRLSLDSREQLISISQLLRYRLGQTIVVREAIPANISIIYSGQARLLAYTPGNIAPETLKLLSSGDIIGWVSLLRQVPCETVLAASEAVCLTIKAKDFLTLLKQESEVAAAFDNRCALIEVFDLLGTELQRQTAKVGNLKQLALNHVETAVVMNLPPGKTSLHSLEPNLLWLLSGGTTNFAVGDRLLPNDSTPDYIQVSSPSARLVGFIPVLNQKKIAENALANLDIPYAPERPEALETQKRPKYPYIHARGSLNATLACFQMLSQYWGLPFRKEVLRRALANSLERHGNISLLLCGVVAELMSVKSQLVDIPAMAIARLPTPAIITWLDSFALLYKASEVELVLAVPETGIHRLKLATFIESWGESGQVLLLQPTADTPTERFGLSWFLPSLYRYRRVLLEVFVASFFGQLFALANPLITQVIIDSVIMQNSAETLQVLGSFVVVLAVFEAIITNLRTNLFVDTTNRIDLALGAQVIDHLLRLPLRYFERRPVGELASRVNELENIRQFLTGTALTVVLDAVFSVIYVVVMVFYSWTLTLVALATVPLFALLTLIAAPIIRQQSRTKAERNAQTQSYLVEIVSGIQTVKAQNIELRSRWQWQEYYARYVSAGFKNVLTSTTASSISTFLNKLSGLLLLWVGAYLVLQKQLTLGQLIAFRIIASYTTSPLLRLIQLWQNFQETALSLERIGDILDTPTEIEQAGKNNISMPEISGAVKYENVSFRFAASGAPQLTNINLDVSTGTFVGVVGSSGAGKSTLTKILPRLYELNSGRILIDDYDISKVELYSLRSQIGVVLQDTLLFDTTVQDNIALTNPDATSEDIIEAAKVAFAHDFIMALPQGYNTRVGERGAALSGGQRQRIAIARTVLQNPKLLILDEATSALDYNTERGVCLNLATAFKGKTVFFITHRLATIRNADVIVMMDAGTIAEEGTHEQLMAIKGRYYCLYQQQEANT
jgi:HlyB family type I secretion system ABC transporter